MHILGISCFYHDAAAALLRDGALIAAAEEERFSRIKHDFGFPERSVKYCLEEAGITAGDLDYVVFYEKPFRKFDRILMTSFQSFPRSWRTFGEAMISWLGDKLWMKNVIQTKKLMIPHPRMNKRNFALIPLQEIAPNAVHPLLRKKIDVLCRKSTDLSVVIKIRDGVSKGRKHVVLRPQRKAALTSI